MHEWAVTVERLGGQIAEDLKSGRGPAPLLDWLALVGEALAIEDAGGIVHSDLAARILALREDVLPILQEGTR